MGASGEVVEIMTREDAHSVSGVNDCRAFAACVWCARVLCAYATGLDTREQVGRCTIAHSGS
eukprot:5825709-Pleurochrysis_carterae.AAC.2